MEENQKVSIYNKGKFVGFGITTSKVIEAYGLDARKVLLHGLHYDYFYELEYKDGKHLSIEDENNWIVIS